MATSRQTRAQQQRAKQDRQRQVAALRLAGVRDQQTIADRLGVSVATISRDFADLDALYRERAAADIATAKGHDLERIEEMIKALWPDALKGKWLATDRITNLLARKAAMLGYDAPQKRELTGAGGGPIQQAHSVTANADALAAAEAAYLRTAGLTAPEPPDLGV